LNFSQRKRQETFRLREIAIAKGKSHGESLLLNKSELVG
jgi:hypothetical protein